MAKQNSLFPFTRKLGKVIGYERNGKFFLRKMPEFVRQNAATRSAAQRFGIASKKGALIRHTFYTDLDIRCDDGHINRLNKAFIAAGNNNAAITGFRFNQHTGIDRFLSIAPRLFRNETLHIPKQTLAHHKGITALEVKVIAKRIDFLTPQVTGTETVTIAIDPRQPFDGADIPLNVPGEGTLVITMQIRGMHEDRPSCNRQYLAADIVAVAAPQIPDKIPHNKPTYPQPTANRQNLTPAHNYQTLIQRE
ncbi:hypothetical protein [Chitinophaga ginsengisoli]|uniref:Uncharacterized protein n=1 Tax=Chitinophaga ginsengisoli TaxID=363837 RepID=A0A2P8FTL6_9BACT|nr:hypothetical protein [Chitinophaga ginsengisoli]PSL25041.1 hypothetical protein CLV42_114190 [Chitinophaga ginsengisoli]